MASLTSPMSASALFGVKRHSGAMTTLRLRKGWPACILITEHLSPRHAQGTCRRTGPQGSIWSSS